MRVCVLVLALSRRLPDVCYVRAARPSASPRNTCIKHVRYGRERRIVVPVCVCCAAQFMRARECAAGLKLKLGCRRCCCAGAILNYGANNGRTRAALPAAAIRM